MLRIGISAFSRTKFYPLQSTLWFRHASTVRSLTEKPNEFSALKWVLLLIPVSTFGLGTWQVHRRNWKRQLIADLKAKTTAVPCSLPHELEELRELEYCPVRVQGEFDHSRELYLGPRSLLVDGDASSQGSFTSTQKAGYLVITPFHLSDRPVTILVNRGWVPAQNKNPKTRTAGQIAGEVEVVGIVRLEEKRGPFTPKNQPGTWFYKDLQKMAEVAGTEPIFIDATSQTTVPGGPIGGQTRVSLRDEHLSYLLTWYGLSGCTAYMWYRMFIKRKPLL